MNRFVLGVFMVATLVFTTISCGNDADGGKQDEVSYSIAEEHVKVWDVALEQILELIDSMPGDRLNFTPDDTLRTFSEQIVHIGISSQMIMNLFLKDVPRPEKMPEVNAAEMTKEDLKTFITDQMNKVRATIAGMSNDQLLNEKVTSYMDHEMTRLEGMMFAHDHLTNHKAKANLYIRLVGQRPPGYRYY